MEEILSEVCGSYDDHHRRFFFERFNQKKIKMRFRHKRSKKKRIRTTWLERKLPSEVVHDIFSRLPITSLYQTRFVCLSWSNLIKFCMSNGVFAVNHYKQLMSSKNLNHPNSIIFESNFEGDLPVYYIADINHFDKPVKFRQSALDSLLHDYYIVAAVNGFLFIAGTRVKDNLQFVIYNPVIGDLFKLLYPPHADDLSSSSIFLAFGYSPKTSRYKAVRMVTRDENFTLDTLTIGTKSWRTSGPFNVEFPLYSGINNHGVFVHGHIHWLAVDYLSTPECFVVQTFNVEEETFQMMHVPAALKNSTISMGLRLGILDGCIAVVGYSQGRTDIMQVWLMKNYRLHEWTLEFSFTAGKGWGTLLLPLAILNDGTLLLADNCKLFCFNPKSEITQCIQSDGFPSWFRAFPHAANLASLGDVLTL